ncbi:MAG TPA: hypothetical protein VKD24_03495 [Candidatus Angelobacter sp.]|nr:hypothetical protein [Candidatus Angelobacter sp.]
MIREIVLVVMVWLMFVTLVAMVTFVWFHHLLAAVVLAPVFCIIFSAFMTLQYLE